MYCVNYKAWNAKNTIIFYILKNNWIFCLIINNIHYIPTVPTYVTQNIIHQHYIKYVVMYPEYKIKDFK